MKKSFKKVSKESEEGAEPGTLVRIHIKNVSANLNISNIKVFVL
jgi:hypothetical protein